MDLDPNAPLLAEQLDRDLLQLVPPELAVCIEGELRGDAQHLVHLPEEAGRLGGVCVNLVDDFVQAPGLGAECLEPVRNDLPRA